jgi:hypothetical protein
MANLRDELGRLYSVEPTPTDWDGVAGRFGDTTGSQNSRMAEVLSGSSDRRSSSYRAAIRRLERRREALREGRTVRGPKAAADLATLRRSAAARAARARTERVRNQSVRVRVSGFLWKSTPQHSDSNRGFSMELSAEAGAELYDAFRSGDEDLLQETWGDLTSEFYGVDLVAEDVTLSGEWL